ncbi:MAG: DUF1932 domain-containing protein [Spirochaetes bacterium]|nr:DUF1932 domain-containing protein [Spirochaetota bacterium]
MLKAITFIGFGEASYHIAKGLRTEGFPVIKAFDLYWNHPEKGQLIQQRAAELGVELFPTLPQAVQDVQFVVSATSAKAAFSVAETVFPFLEEGQVFIDINAASPITKKRIDALPRKKGVRFCDAAVMGIVPSEGHRVPMLLSGDGASILVEALSSYGMRLTDIKAPAGGSSAIKMFRSVFMKGFTQLLIESFTPAKQFGALETLVDSLNETFQGKSIEDLANELIPRTLVHAARRISEMEEVILTLKEMHLDASMSESTKKKLELIVASSIPTKLKGNTPSNYRKAIDFLQESI